MNWRDLMDFGNLSDVTFYFLMAAIGTLLFLLRLVLTIFAGVDGDVDFDGDIEGGLEAHGADFSLFSLLSIVSFIMGAGWMGLACRVQWGMGSMPTFFAACGFGLFLMLISSFGMWQMRRMNVAGGYDPKNAVGRTARVYLRIPAKGEGQGQVQVDLDGSQRVMHAVSKGPAIESFATVTILDVRDGETFIVEPV